jgi:NADH dehydrogenase FAD-containing subunit
MSATTSVTVVGGGFAGLETTFGLRAKLGERARLTLVSDRDDFLFKPNTIYIPFGADPASLLIPLARPAAKRDIRLVRAPVDAVDRDTGTVHAGGEAIRSDYTVLATGAGMRPDEIPGLAEHAETIWTPAEMAALGARLRDVLARAASNEGSTILFTVPPGNKCAGPLYELVLMTETWLRRKRVRDRVRLLWATFESSYIQAFGPKLHDVVVTEFEQRGIEGRTGLRLVEVTPEAARYADGTELPYDVLVAFPPYVAAVDYDGFERDERGFLRTELETRVVAGTERVFAPGDAGDFPVKQAFLAFLQADAVAERIAAEAAGREPAFAFDPVSMCVMEEYDTATFAQVPLLVTGDPERPVAVRPDANGSYRVGVSPLWRLGKKMLGLYLPLRFRNGLPFHEGAPWRAMEAGLRGMSAALARR